MKVKEWIKELECYDEDAEVIFEFDDEIDVESWTENKYGFKSVWIDKRLKETFSSERDGNCCIELGVAEEEK